MALLSTSILDCIDGLFDSSIINSLWYFERGIDDIILFIITDKIEALEYINKQLVELDTCNINIEVVILERELELFNIEGAKKII
ncbi:MAG: hypothetical protein KatS3mg003_0615 [Candidatus Nitrosocaldaceae archaeon]|nr:MAG: hypothetical protein KatS3mg003_0615 [Candidatus Nitrosocaldaceae archaeon]